MVILLYKVMLLTKITLMRINKMKNSDKGFFGKFGGRFVPAELEKLLIELENAFLHYINDKEFLEELAELRADFIGRPTPLMYAKNLSEKIGGAKIYVKLEGLAHTGAHKINNSIGQALLAKKMGKKKIIAETGAGQHGLATAAACAKLGMECSIYMGEIDVKRQQPNVASMELYGANVISVTRGGRGLKDAVDVALEDWVKDLKDTHYLLGSAVGPSPYPDIVRTFQSVIGRELEKQIQEKNLNVKAMIACVGGGSNAMGMFYNFISDKEVELIGCEAAGKGIDTKMHAASIAKGSIGIFHGMKSYFCQNEFGQITPVYSISAGLDYPGIGPEHSHLYKTGRAKYVPVTDDEAVDAFEYLAKKEGIICAIESAHAMHYAIKEAPKMNKDDIIIVCLSGRGDKDVAQIARYKGHNIYE